MKENNDIQLAYLSFATRRLKVNLDQEIQMILDESRKHNEEHGITGQLIYRGGIFLQLLEGDKDQVSLLLGRIMLDKTRHENIKILLKQPLFKRVFPDWSMAYIKLDNVALDIVNSIVPWQNLISPKSENKNIPTDDILKIFTELAA